MDIKDLADHLAERCPNIIIHPAFYDDIAVLFKNSGAYNIFLRKLYPKLDQLSIFKHEAFQKCSDFKRMGSTPLTRFTVKLDACNGKILYSTAGNNPIILLIFNEDEGKRSTDYTKYIPIAEERLKELRGTIGNENAR